MKTHVYGTEGNPSLMLLPGLGVSYEMFLPLISLLKDRFHIVAVEVDGRKELAEINSEYSEQYAGTGTDG